METELRVLLALSDRSISQTLIDKFRQKYPSCPLGFDVAEDGHRALNEVRFFKHPVALVDRNFPGRAGEDLAQGILGLYSECHIIIAVPKGETVKTGFAHLELPILSWDRAILEMTRGLPMDFQIQYSLFERNLILLQRLESYALKYQDVNQDETIAIRAWNLNPEIKGSTEKSRVPSARNPHSTESLESRTFEVPIRATKFEVGVIAVLGILVGLSWFAFEIEGAFGWTIKMSLLLTLVFCCFGFFALRLSGRGQKI